MIKRINKSYAIADTKEDLKNLVSSMGDECYVIQEACEYKAMSNGKWVKQSIANSEIDTSNFATKEELNNLAPKNYVDEAISNINNIPVMKMFEEDPAIMESNPGSKFGIALNNGDTRTLPEAMLEKGIGMYNFWIHKSNTSLPEKVISKKSSCRGLCCVDTVKETGWYGWILLFDQDGEVYSQYIRNSEPKGWKHFVTE